MKLRDAIFKKFVELPVGEPYKIQEKVSPENQQLFIETSKQLIDEDLLPDHYLEFSDDYSQIKKKLKPIKQTLRQF